MKAEITLSDGKKYNCQITKDNNKLILNFEKTKLVPYGLLAKGQFNINIQLTDPEINCTGCCDTCLTPIC